MKTLNFQATKREAGGKKGAKALRNAGMIPCEIYGGGENIHFAVPEKEIKTLIYTPHSYVINFDIEGKKEVVVMREVQFHPVRDEILHIDFYRVQEGKPLVMEVPIELTGTAQGVREGGKLSLAKRKVFISGLVEDLPDTVEVDVTNVKLGGSIFVGDLKADKYAFVTPATTAICAVRMTRAARGAAAKAGN